MEPGLDGSHAKECQNGQSKEENNTHVGKWNRCKSLECLSEQLVD